MNLNEAEIQVLAQIRGAEIDSEPTDRESLEDRGTRYWIYREDWNDAFSSLGDKGLIDGEDNAYRLTDAGRPNADAYYQQRPDMYWYYFQRLYAALYESEAHKKLCKRVFGRDLCQENMTDMRALDGVLQKLSLKAGDHVLDLGCGAGGIAEYISGETSASITGIDYSATAISTAIARTEDKREMLNFLEGDLNTLELPEKSFDAAYSIDSIYWVADTTDAVRRIARGIKPGGKLAILIVQIGEYCERPEELEMHGTYVAEALRNLKLEYQAYDYTDDFRDFWPRVKEAAAALRKEYEREGNAFIADNYIKEADTEFLPAIEADEIRRYLYIATI
jgi:ubiquinone/menaquinone biosynthesis C-methylase UbiE